MTDDEALAYLQKRGIPDSTIALLKSLLPSTIDAIIGSTEAPIAPPGSSRALVLGDVVDRRQQDDFTGRPQLERSKRFLVESYGTLNPDRAKVRTGEMMRDAAKWFGDRSFPVPDKSIIFEAAGRAKGPQPKKTLP